MKMLTAGLAICLLTTFCAAQTATKNIFSLNNAALKSDQVRSAEEPDAYTIKDIWADHDAFVGGRYGIRIHAAVVIKEMRNQPVDIAFYVMENIIYTDSYIRHAGAKDMYHDDSGYLRVKTTVTPGFDNTTFDDITAFIPYEAFRLGPGEYDLLVSVYALYPAGNVLAHLNSYEFEYYEPDASRGNTAAKSITRNNSGPSARCDSMWVEHNVLQDGQKGMKIHFKFTTWGMKDSSAYLFTHVAWADGRTGVVKDKNGKYNTNHGGTATWASLKPGYETTYFNDFVLFLPTAEIELPAGSYRLVLDTKLMLDKGGVVAYFPFYSFDLNL